MDPVSNIDLAAHGVYLTGFEHSLELSLIASVLPGIFGLLIAYAIFTAKAAAHGAAPDGDHRLRRVRQLRRRAAGVPVHRLARARPRLVTGWLNDIGLNIYNDGFTLYTWPASPWSTCTSRSR